MKSQRSTHTPISTQEEKQDKQSLQFLLELKRPSSPSDLLDEFDRRFAIEKSSEITARNTSRSHSALKVYIKAFIARRHGKVIIATAACAMLALVLMLWFFRPTVTESNIEYAAKEVEGISKTKPPQKPTPIDDPVETLTGNTSAAPDTDELFTVKLEQLLERVQKAKASEVPRAFGIGIADTNAIEYWIERIKAIPPSVSVREIDGCLKRGLAIDNRNLALFFSAGKAYEKHQRLMDAGSCYFRAMRGKYPGAKEAYERIVQSIEQP